MKKQTKKAADKKALNLNAKKSSNKEIPYWALIKLSDAPFENLKKKEFGYMFLAFHEALTLPELKGFGKSYLAQEFGAKAVVIDEQTYNYWIDEDVKNSTNSPMYGFQPFGFRKGDDDGIYEAIVKLNPGVLK